LELNIFLYLLYKLPTAGHIHILHTKYYSGDKFQENEVGGTCDMYERQERCIPCFGRKAGRK
jgi:hypothetical protein